MSKVKIAGWGFPLSGGAAHDPAPIVDLGAPVIHIWNPVAPTYPMIRDVCAWPVEIGSRDGGTYLVRAGTSGIRRKTLGLSKTTGRRVTIDA
jgi:hypothetical protein